MFTGNARQAGAGSITLRQRGGAGQATSNCSLWQTARRGRKAFIHGGESPIVTRYTSHEKNCVDE